WIVRCWRAPVFPSVFWNDHTLNGTLCHKCRVRFDEIEPDPPTARPRQHLNAFDWVVKRDDSRCGVLFVILDGKFDILRRERFTVVPCDAFAEVHFDRFIINEPAAGCERGNDLQARRGVEQAIVEIPKPKLLGSTCRPWLVE